MMYRHTTIKQKNKSASTVGVTSKNLDGDESTIHFVDNRPEASIQRKQTEAMANYNINQPVQKKDDSEYGLGENNTGLPNNLKSGVENLSGIDMSDTRVHYNSNKPVQLNALAYAQGSDIHLASGQEKHLPHEAWHVVQQKQGRVKPTMQLKDKLSINDDVGLEMEADAMGEKALQTKSIQSQIANSFKHSIRNGNSVSSYRSRLGSDNSEIIQRVVHLTSGGYTEDGNTPKYNIPIGKHWVFFDVTRWNNDENYRGRMQRLYDPMQAPAYNPTVTPIDIPLDKISNDGSVKEDATYGEGMGGDRLGLLRGERKQIVTNTSQTGDIPHIASAMANNPLLDVIIVYKNAKQEVAQSMKDTYENAIAYQITPPGITRVKLLQEEDDPRYSWYNALIPDHSEVGPVGPPKWRSESAEHENYYSYPSLSASEGRSEYDMMYVGGTTSEVARQYDSLGDRVFFEKNKAALTDRRLDDRSMIRFFAKYFHFDLGINSGKNRLLLIWGRYSGSVAGGYNPAGDSSLDGNAQLVNSVANKTGRIPIAIGHDSTDGPTPQGLIHLGEFWTLHVEDNPFMGRGRSAQTAFYILLNKTHDVVQLGQKTGGIDNAALVGIRTIYIEDEYSPQYGRMQKWSRIMRHYQAAITNNPPTKLGKAIRKAQGDIDESGGTHKGGTDRIMLRAEETSDQFDNTYGPRDLDTIIRNVSKMDQVQTEGALEKVSGGDKYGKETAEFDEVAYNQQIAILRSLGPNLKTQFDDDMDENPDGQVYDGYELTPSQIVRIRGRKLLPTPPDGDCSINAVLESLPFDAHPRTIRYRVAEWALSRGMISEGDAIKMRQPGEFGGNISPILLQGLANIERISITVIRPGGSPWHIIPERESRADVVIVYVYGANNQGHYYGTRT